MVFVLLYFAPYISSFILTSFYFSAKLRIKIEKRHFPIEYFKNSKRKCHFSIQIHLFATFPFANYITPCLLSLSTSNSEYRRQHRSFVSLSVPGHPAWYHRKRWIENPQRKINTATKRIFYVSWLIILKHQHIRLYYSILQYSKYNKNRTNSATNAQKSVSWLFIPLFSLHFSNKNIISVVKK